MVTWRARIAFPCVHLLIENLVKGGFKTEASNEQEREQTGNRVLRLPRENKTARVMAKGKQSGGTSVPILTSGLVFWGSFYFYGEVMSHPWLGSQVKRRNYQRDQVIP